MRKVVATTISLLLLTSCSQPQQNRKLTGIVELYCFAVGGPRSGNLIIDTSNWKLLHYDIDIDKFREQKTTTGLVKGREVTWTTEKQDNTLVITSREAYTEKYIEDRINKSNRAHSNIKRYGPRGVMFNQQQLSDFDKFTENRREDYGILRIKVDLKTLSADLYEKEVWEFMPDSQETKSGTGRCLVSDPPKTLMTAGQ